MWYVAGIPVVERNRGLIVSGFLFTPLACLSVSLRIFTRAVLVGRVGLDDCTILAAMLGSIATLIAIMYQIEYGLGGTIDSSMMRHFFQAQLASIIAYGFTQNLVKLSIVLQCRRIFSSTNAQRLFTGLLIWFSIYGLFCVLSSIITCWPVAKFWDESIPGGCMDRSTLYYVHGGFNIVNDFTLLIAPLPYLKKLHIARRAKLVLIGVFGCGAFACIIAIIRLNSLHVSNSVPLNQQPIKGVDIATWSVLEINVAIICACVPALKPLFVKAFPHISSFTNSHKRSQLHPSTHGIIPLGSIDRQNTEAIGSEADGAIIRVHQSFQMKAVSTDGDDKSDKNLVTEPGPSTWTTY